LPFCKVMWYSECRPMWQIVNAYLAGSLARFPTLQLVQNLTEIQNLGNALGLFDDPM